MAERLAARKRPCEIFASAGVTTPRGTWVAA